MTPLHTLLSITLLLTPTFLIYTKPLDLLGFLHGPSVQLSAYHQQHKLHSHLRNLPVSQRCPVQGDDDRAMVLRDAGTIAAMFAFFIPCVKRRYLAIVAPLMWITPGCIGQVLFSKRVPVEVSLIHSRGLVRGSFDAGYCLISQVFLSGGEERTWWMMVCHELQIVAIAGFLVFLFLGIMPKIK